MIGKRGISPTWPPFPPPPLRYWDCNRRSLKRVLCMYKGKNARKDEVTKKAECERKGYILGQVWGKEFLALTRVPHDTKTVSSRQRWRGWTAAEAHIDALKAHSCLLVDTSRQRQCPLWLWLTDKWQRRKGRSIIMGVSIVLYCIV